MEVEEVTAEEVMEVMEAGVEEGLVVAAVLEEDGVFDIFVSLKSMFNAR